MGTSQNLPVAVRVVRRERGLMISERDMELYPEPISSALPFLLIVSELGLPSASAPIPGLSWACRSSRASYSMLFPAALGTYKSAFSRPFFRPDESEDRLRCGLGLFEEAHVSRIFEPYDLRFGMFGNHA